MGCEKYEINELGDILIPEEETRLEDKAFWGIEKKIRRIKCPDSLRIVGECLFMGGTEPKLINADLGQGVEVIGRAAFAGCSEMKEIVFGNKLRHIEETAFWGCYGLKSMDLSNTQLETIGSHAFANSSLTDVLLPDTLLEIGDEAFSHSRVAKIIIPQSVQKLGNRSLETCLDVTLYDTYPSRPNNIFDDWGYVKYRTSYRDHAVTVKSSQTGESLYSLFFSGDEGDDYHNKLRMWWRGILDFDFEEYDRYFLNLKSDKSKYKTAELRLKNPMNLKDKYRNLYEQYIKYADKKGLNNN